MTDGSTRAMAGIAGAVAIGSTIAPRKFLGLFGVPAPEITGPARFALGLFATRNAYIAALALRDDPAAKAAFLPLQAMDQVVFWQAYRARWIPQRGAVLAATVSAGIVALDVQRRRTVAQTST